MAVTSLWAIKGRIDHLIHYVENPEKTKAGIADKDLQALWDVVSYTTNANKTEQRLFVSGINCLPEIAVQEMVVVKKQFRKETGRLAYHGILSFKPGEVTPEQCHEIGLRLAREMWGKKYQIVVTTHLDRDHLHCHFAFNSVSFVDGKKYDRTNAEYARMRTIADRLCREHELSVIKEPQKTKTPRMIYLAEKKGEPTRYNVFRQAIDRAIAGSMTKHQFESVLKAQGFEMKLYGKYWTIKTKGDDRATRLYRLGEQYTGASITSRICEGGLLKRPVLFQKAQPTVTKSRYHGDFKKATKLTGFRALYYRWLYILGKLPKPRPPRHPILWEEVRKLHRFSEQIRLLCRYKMDTSEQLQVFTDSTKSQMDELIRQRTKIQNKLRRAKDPEIITVLKAKKTALTEHITPLRKNLKLADGIAENTARMKEKMALVYQLEQQEKEKNKSKSRIKSREDRDTR